MGSAWRKRNTNSDEEKAEKIKNFEEWAKKRDLNQNTIETLIGQDWDDFSVLTSVLDVAFQKLTLNSDQQNFLLNAVAELRITGGLDYLAPADIEIGFQDQEEEENNDMVVKAMFDRATQENSELNFKAGDTFTMTEKSKQHGWWWLRHAETGKEGFVPTNTIVPETSDIKQNAWWVEVDKEGAERQLFLYGDDNGAFLVRSSSEGTLKLSVRFDHTDPKADGVIHYTLTLEDCGKCFIDESLKFSSVADLIQYYKANKVLCCQLTNACTEVRDSVPYRVIEESTLTFDEKIGQGEGSYTDICKGKWRNQLDVALKKVALNRDGIITSSNIREREKLEKLQALCHENLAQRIGACYGSHTTYIVEELMIHGCLRNYLIKEGPENVDLRDLAEFATQIASGMEYLASRNIVHRNVKAENMLVGTNKTVKVSGLGLVRFISKNEENYRENIYISTECQIEFKWAALEVMETEVFSIKSDVWSFGVLLYELLTYGGKPYVGMDNEAVIAYLRKNGRLEIPDTKVCPKNIYDRMLQCWDANPKKRPSFDELHNFFATFDPDYV